jgi:Reverse transcriptase (RNA-dependent DNA polymerase)
MRDIFLQPPKEMQLSSDEFLKLMKPLYGLSDSGDSWYHTLRHYHLQDLQMEPLNVDPSLYFRSIGNLLIGLSGVYVDDMLRCGTPDFLPDSKTTSRIFDATPETMRTANFAGVNLRQTESVIETDMSDYIEKLTFPLDQSWKHFASFPAKLAWIVYARPDICARVVKLAQVTEQHFRTDAQKYFRMLEDGFQQVRKYDMFLDYPALDLDSLYVCGYADVSFGMIVDGSGQIGYCILLMDKFNRFAIIKFRSGKCHRVTHSAKAAETCAFAEAFDAAFVLKHSLARAAQASDSVADAYRFETTI